MTSRETKTANGESGAQTIAKTRGISERTQAAFGVTFGTDFFPGTKRELPSVRFPYGAAYKARAISEKYFTCSKGFKSEFFNLAAVLASLPSRVYICEGEFDALAIAESGIPQNSILSVPNGAREKPVESGNSYVVEAIEAGLKNISEIVWVGDSDAPGLVLRSEMARIFGAARFWFLNWPEGIKDANQMLLADGPNDLRELLLHGALQWPVEGLYHLDEIPEMPPLTIWDPGFPEWESKIQLGDRCLSVATGHPGHGKTVLWQQIWFNVLKKYGLRAAIASFETPVRPQLIRQLRSLYCGALARDLIFSEIAAADKWIREHYLFISHRQGNPNLEWLLDLAEVAVVRHGAKIVQIDPWNALSHERAKNETEVEYIGHALREMRLFARELNCHVQIIAHPAKMHDMRRGEAPLLEDIAGAKHWDNAPDQGFTVHRKKFVEDDGNRVTTARLYHRKARFEELGYQCHVDIEMDLSRGCFVSCAPPGHEQTKKDKPRRGRRQADLVSAMEDDANRRAGIPD